MNVAKFLLNQKCDVNKMQRSDMTALHIAAAASAPETLLAKLLKLGAHIDATDDCSYTPLCHAAEADQLEILDWLLDHGADITRGHEKGTRPSAAHCGAITMNSPRI